MSRLDDEYVDRLDSGDRPSAADAVVLGALVTGLPGVMVGRVVAWGWPGAMTWWLGEAYRPDAQEGIGIAFVALLVHLALATVGLGLIVWWRTTRDGGRARAFVGGLGVGLVAALPLGLGCCLALPA